MIKLILAGCNGKMGGVITSLCANDDDVRIIAGIDINTEKKGGFDVYSNPADIPETADVIIDFSHPDMFDRILDYAVNTNTSVIFATTGLSDEQKNRMKEASQKAPVFFSANMSLGVNLLTELVCAAARVLGDSFDIELIEKHHNRKIDAPSGTALAIADAVNEALSEKREYVYDRHSVRKKRAKSELGIHTVRGGTIVGEHEVIFAGLDEIIEIKHTATSRDLFATGAIKAAKYMAGKPAGFYSMRDLLK